MKVKHVASGTRVGGAVFAVRRKWMPWDECSYVRATEHPSGDHEYEIWAGQGSERTSACLRAVDDHLSELFDRRCGS